MRAFFDLAGDRHEGGRIPWSTIRSWCDAMGFLGDEADDAHFLLSRMDVAYMTWARERGKKLSDDNKRAQENRDANPRRVR